MKTPKPKVKSIKVRIKIKREGEREKEKEVAVRKSRKKVPERPVPKPGGKALERLHQFERQRGFEETDIKKP
jgi:hypothetical protein